VTTGVTRTVLAAEGGSGGLLFHLTLLVTAGHRSASHLAKQVGPYRGVDQARFPVPPAGAAQSRGNPPLFKADTVNIEISASKDREIAWFRPDGMTLRSFSERLRPDPAWRPLSDRPASPLLVTSGEGGAYPATVTRHATSSRTR
jgi:hypothetical protein